MDASWSARRDNKSRISRSIRAIRIDCLSLFLAIRSARIPSAEFIAPPMAARIFKKFLAATTTPAATTWKSIHQIQMFLYASLWCTRQGPWEDGNTYNGVGGLFKSTDGGDNWKPLTNGLPEGVSQVDIAIAPSNSNRVYATVAFPRGVQIFSSDDAGENLDARDHGYSPRDSNRRRRFAGAKSGSEKSGRSLHHQHGDVAHDGRGKNMDWNSRRSGRRRLSKYLDQSE